MIPIEKKLDAIIRHLTAETEPERRKTLIALRQIAAEIDAIADDRSVEYDIRRLLLDIGVPENVKGHAYLVEAIRMVSDQPNLIGWITKRIYPAVAAKFATTPAMVERGLRHGIECAWSRGDLSVLQRYFGNTVDPTKGRPTNSQFIFRVANVIRQYK